jgi:Tfp pilus assembly protein PilF
LERASCFLQQGNYVKARQQIDASLRQDKSDLQALRLRNEINQCLMR